MAVFFYEYIPENKFPSDEGEGQNGGEGTNKNIYKNLIGPLPVLLRNPPLPRRGIQVDYTSEAQCNRHGIRAGIYTERIRR